MGECGSRLSWCVCCVLCVRARLRIARCRRVERETLRAFVCARRRRRTANDGGERAHPSSGGPAEKQRLLPSPLPNTLTRLSASHQTCSSRHTSFPTKHQARRRRERTDSPITITLQSARAFSTSSQHHADDAHGSVVERLVLREERQGLAGRGSLFSPPSKTFFSIDPKERSASLSPAPPREASDQRCICTT